MLAACCKHTFACVYLNIINLQTLKNVFHGELFSNEIKPSLIIINVPETYLTHISFYNSFN